MKVRIIHTNDRGVHEYAVVKAGDPTEWLFTRSHHLAAMRDCLDIGHEMLLPITCEITGCKQHPRD